MQKSTITLRPSYSAEPSLIWGGLIICGVIGYNLPWLISAGTGLTFGAYDLAEWVSLIPAVRTNGLLIESALLRLPPLCLAILVAFNAQKVYSWSGLFILLTSITLLPPLDFLTQPGDPNYRQQVFIALATFTGGICGLSGLLQRWRWLIGRFLAVVGIVVTIAGAFFARKFLGNFGLEPSIGAGIPLMIGVFALTAMWMMFVRIKTGQQK